jgi:hypothetical protein
VVAIGNRSVLVTLVPVEGVETSVRIEILREMRLRTVVVSKLLMASVGIVPNDWDRAGVSPLPWVTWRNRMHSGQKFSLFEGVNQIG